jgi:hypothetical protein
MVIGVTLAESWRRAVYHDSYANYLPNTADGDDVSADAEESGGPARRAANRLWAPVAASAKRDWSRLQRMRAGAPRPSAGAPVGAPDRPVSAP